MAEVGFELEKELLDELQFRATRASGPGGQNVNKVNTKIELRWKVTVSQALPQAVLYRFSEIYRTRITKEGELILSSGRFREQPRNKEDCLKRLAEMIGLASRPPKKRKKTKVPRSVNERRIEKKARTSARKTDRRRPKADD